MFQVQLFKLHSINITFICINLFPRKGEGFFQVGEYTGRYVCEFWCCRAFVFIRVRESLCILQSKQLALILTNNNINRNIFLFNERPTQQRDG